MFADLYVSVVAGTVGAEICGQQQGCGPFENAELELFEPYFDEIAYLDVTSFDDQLPAAELDF